MKVITLSSAASVRLTEQAASSLAWGAQGTGYRGFPVPFHLSPHGKNGPTMRRDEIRSMVRSHLAQKGYCVDQFAWHRPVKLTVELPSDNGDVLQVFKIAAPMAKWRLREILQDVPRRGPPRLGKKRVTLGSYTQPDLSAHWG